MPGSSSIEENAILKRMERELGQEFTPRSNRPPELRTQKNQGRKKAPEAPRFNVTLSLGGDLRIDGRIALTQRTLELTETRNGVAVRHRIPMLEIGQLEFLDWKAVRLHKDPGGETRRLVFFPTRCRLTRRDQSQLEGKFAAFDWLEFRMQSGLSFGNYRTYFSVDPNDPEALATTNREANTDEAAEDPSGDQAENSATETERVPAPEAKATPGSLADWNQRPAPPVPTEIVRSIVFGAPVRSGESDAEKNLRPADATTPSNDNAGDSDQKTLEPGQKTEEPDANFMEADADAIQN